MIMASTRRRLTVRGLWLDGGTNHRKAKYPDRVYAGVIQQNNEGDADCLYGYCKMIKDHLNLQPKASFLPTVGQRRQVPREGGQGPSSQ